MLGRGNGVRSLKRVRPSQITLESGNATIADRPHEIREGGREGAGSQGFRRAARLRRILPTTEGQTVDD